MLYRHIQKNISNSPRKLRLVAAMVRKMTPDQAVEQLMFTNQAAATPLAKAIKTAIANAGRKPGLSFVTLDIQEGLKLKRYHPGTAGRGRGRPYAKRLSHIKIVLTDEVVTRVKNQESSKKEKVEQVKEVAA